MREKSRDNDFTQNQNAAEDDNLTTNLDTYVFLHFAEIFDLNQAQMELIVRPLKTLILLLFKSQPIFPFIEFLELKCLFE